MDLNLTGQAVLVTGGSKGIGLACAAAFAAESVRYVTGAAATVV
jgi:NAD(P)-dependent dehydrogenase (short-subunit alcohol dehydrogenase family)